MIQLLQELEQTLKTRKVIGPKDYVVLNLLTTGGGLLLHRSMNRGIIRESILVEYENLAQLTVKLQDYMKGN